MKRDHPLYFEISLGIWGSNELLSKLLSGKIDFSLLGSVNPLVHPNLQVKLLHQQEFLSLCQKENPLAEKEISFEEAAEYPFILLERLYPYARLSEFK